ncbi:glycosyltransferase family 2 protein [Roseateles sp.]|uniref:glycosyltransferase family 2 protein n=1 Tax=Roseateles sp. TaxID=1971397 RepID=UPI0025EF3770|nr:glycosyltransferase family 2 protein [Roseateles sp.]MBV8037095.1 glycosyltransferase family 2 protein [Roseateles sp.]
MSAVTRDPGASLDVILPAFNEAANLMALFAQLQRVLGALTPRWRILLIDDGSSDDTGAVALAARASGLPLRYVRLSRNFGKEAALTAGLAVADADRVLLMDADGQHAPELIAQMDESWQRGVDMVCAVRANRNEEGLLKRLGTNLFYSIVNASSQLQIPPDAGDFRMLDRRVVAALNALPERNRFMKGLYAWVGFRTEFLSYTPLARTAGSSSFSMRRLIRLALTGVTAFSNLPLRIWSGLGALAALGGLAYGAWIVAEHLIYGDQIPGWATVVVGLMFFGGIQMLSIGIIGEYVGRIFDEVKHRPVYLIAQDTGNPP